MNHTFWAEASSWIHRLLCLALSCYLSIPIIFAIFTHFAITKISPVTLFAYLYLESSFRNFSHHIHSIYRHHLSRNFFKITKNSRKFQKKVKLISQFLKTKLPKIAIKTQILGGGRSYFTF